VSGGFLVLAAEANHFLFRDFAFLRVFSAPISVIFGPGRRSSVIVIEHRKKNAVGRGATFRGIMIL